MKPALQVALFCLLSTPLFAQFLTPDPAFGSNGTGYQSLHGVHTEIAIKPDKSILVGNITYYNDDTVAMGITALRADGTIDTTFGIGGFREYTPVDYNYCTFRNLKVLADGKILIGGLVDVLPNEDTYYMCVRLLPDGTPDSSFNQTGYLFLGPNTEEAFIALSVDVDSLGRYYFIGAQYSGIAIMRVLENGVPDPGFGEAGIIRVPYYPDATWLNRGSEIHILPDGRLLTTSMGFKSSLRGNIIARFHADGSLDTTFGEQGVRYIEIGEDHGSVFTIHPQPDGTIIYKDNLSWYNSAHLFKLDADGNLLTSFGENGFVFIDSVANSSTRQTLIAAPDGSLLMLTGEYKDGHYIGRLSRHDQNFTQDPDFGNSGYMIIANEGQEVALYGGIFQDDQQLIVNALTGTSLNYHNRIYRFTWQDQINSIIKQDDDSSLVIYPNPAHSCFSIKGMPDESNPTSIHLVNVQGQIIQSWSSGDGSTFFIRHPIAPGLYYVNIIDQRNTVTLPILVASVDSITTQ